MKRFFWRLIIGLILVYFIVMFFSQQNQLDQYASETKEYQNEIEDAKDKHNELNETISNMNSLEYIENIARDKLDMYLPNEKVYIDSNK